MKRQTIGLLFLVILQCLATSKCDLPSAFRGGGGEVAGIDKLCFSPSHIVYPTDCFPVRQQSEIILVEFVLQVVTEYHDQISKLQTATAIAKSPPYTSPQIHFIYLKFQYLIIKITRTG